MSNKKYFQFSIEREKTPEIEEFFRNQANKNKVFEYVMRKYITENGLKDVFESIMEDQFKRKDI